MKILSFESTGGASGDMILAALFSLGVDPDTINSRLRGLAIEDFHLHIDRSALSRQISGVRVHVHVGHEHDHDHDHSHHHAPHRGLKEINDLLGRADLPEAVRAMALRVFDAIGEAEARIHGVPKATIHFHEVGAMDSILDIVGSCLALHELGVDGVCVGPLPQGIGIIQCAHGTFPNPAPATVELLKGMNVVQTDEPFELVTPTAAALLTAWKSLDRLPAGMRLVAVGYGVGHRDLAERPNVLRASLYEEDAASGDHDTCLVLECNLDDTNPELLGALSENLLARGVLDVFWTPVQMKKNRPGALLTVLCQPADRDHVLDMIFRGSTTFGVREHEVHRTKLQRRFESVATPFGEVSVKIGTWRGDDITRAPEMDDCIRLAREHGIAAREVYEAALRARNVD